ncbi:sensor histidine kinase [Haloarchaeobius amylolyticus]|uniref:sensor histidine kinase n=1 Tax=Haloarchaeobius amylolyticus TaxID=1198296 RepID=UPI00226EF365|nr:PAS domain-containing sensor histidine kinase [Haloarchaeobius amylolyticus]
METVRVCLADGSGKDWPRHVSAGLADHGHYDVVVTTTLSETLSALDEQVHCLVVGTTLDGDDGVDLLDAVADTSDTTSAGTVCLFLADDDAVAREALVRDVSEVLAARTVTDDPDVLVKRVVRHTTPAEARPAGPGDTHRAAKPTAAGEPTLDPVGTAATALVDARTAMAALEGTTGALVESDLCDGAWAVLADESASAAAGTVTAPPENTTERLAAASAEAGSSARGTGTESSSGEVLVALTHDGDLYGLLGLCGVRTAVDRLDALGRVVGHALARIHRETDLRRSARHLRAVVDSMPQLVTIKDAAGLHVFVNEAVEAADGPGREEILGNHLTDIVDSEAAETAWANDQAVMASGEPVTDEVTVAVDGVPRLYEVTHAPLFDETGAVEGVINVAMDVTDDRRHVEHLSALYHGTERLLLEETPGDVAELAVELFADVLDYRLTCVYTFDPERDELAPQAWSEELAAVAGDPGAIPRDGGAAWESFVSDEARTEVTEITADGDRVPWGDFVLPLGRHGVVVVGTTDETLAPGDEALAKVLAGSIEAVLNRLDRLQALRDRETELARQNERLDEFASVVSHDLRNPLSVARTYLSLAESDDGDADFTPEIREALDRMDDLVTDVLALARQGRVLGETEPVDLAATATVSWRVVDTGDATLELADDLGTVDADAVRLHQLFENLFRNSVEHGSHPENDQPTLLTVRIGRLDAPDSGFFVEDDGIGIPPDRREAVFQRGVTGSADGTGFGLAIVAAVAEAHGWEVLLLESEQGGARFEFRT